MKGLPVAVLAVGFAAIAVIGGCAGLSAEQKGFIAVEDLRAEATLLLRDGRTRPFAEAFPEYRRRAVGHPLPVEEIDLAGMIEEFRAVLAPFDRHADGVIEKPEIALFYVWVAAANKGLDVASVSIAGRVANGLQLTHNDEHGLRALVREIPAANAEAGRRRDALFSLESYLDPETGGASVLGGLGQANRDLD